MTWLSLIEQQTELANDGSINSEKPALIPLPNTNIITISGDEADSFLQNMLTNDVNALTNNQVQLTGLCNPKGRLLAIFWLIKRTQDFLLVLPAELAAPIAQRLTMFKLRSKVDIVVSDTLRAVGLQNPDQKIIALPQHKLDATETAQGLILKLTDSASNYLLIAEEDEVDAISNWLTQGWQLANQAQWQLEDIHAGIPAVFNDSKEQFTPQQVNLDLVGGVSFKKGCYPGQEVVARLHYLGTPSRRMFLAKFEAASLPAPNTAVSDKEGNTIGHVVQAQFDENKQVLCQLSMKLSSADEAAQIEGNKLIDIIALAETEA
jgi:hypothetical protein